MPDGEKTEEQKTQEDIDNLTSTPLIENAKKVAEEIRKEKEELALLVNKLEKLQTRKILGGGSEAGMVPKVDSVKEEKDKINELFKGTGIHLI